MTEIDHRVCRRMRRRRVERWLLVGGLLGVAIGWTRVDGAVEGPVLVTLWPGHGIAAADLPSVVLGLIALWVAVR